MMDVMNLVEEVNDVFYKQVVAQERKGRLCLTDVLDHLRNTYNVDFDIVTMNGRTMVLDVIEY